MTRRLPFLLASLGLLLALALATLWLAPGPVARWRAWQAPEPQPPNLDDVRAARLTANPAAAANYPAILERPLLLPTRRAAAASSETAAAAPPQAIEQAKFTGIISGPTLTGVLLDEQGQPRFVRQGESVGDWRLNAINGRTITFKRGGESKQIELPYASLSAQADGNKGATQAPPPNTPNALNAPNALNKSNAPNTSAPRPRRALSAQP
ncbi:MAG: hypothetical protein LBE78_01460 [Burkholderiaceae bacterium]|jgi:hypothetical protein|nr:hypothetical protein [Burkholderiaceae bacterium]